MANPMMLGMSPEQMQAAREIGKYVGVKFVKRRQQFSVEFFPKRSAEELQGMGIDLGKMTDQWVEALATQFYSYMGIGGEIEDVE